MKKKSARVTVWLTDESLERVEVIGRARDARAGVQISRAEILRLALDRGLDALEADERRFDAPLRVRA